MPAKLTDELLTGDLIGLPKIALRKLMVDGGHGLNEAVLEPLGGLRLLVDQLRTRIVSDETGGVREAQKHVLGNGLSIKRIPVL